MAQEEEFNIFKAASQLFGRKKKKKPSSSTEHPAFKPSEKPGTAATAYRDMEVEDMMKRLRAMDDDLQQKMQRVCELSGMTKKEVERFIENPHNFTESQWKKMLKEKEQLEEKIFAAIGLKAKKRILKKKKQKMIKGRRGKTLGGRKGWIQM